jgi:hypothetical protein
MIFFIITLSIKENKSVQRKISGPEISKSKKMEGAYVDEME